MKTKKKPTVKKDLEKKHKLTFQTYDAGPEVEIIP